PVLSHLLISMKHNTTNHHSFVPYKITNNNTELVIDKNFFDKCLIEQTKENFLSVARWHKMKVVYDNIQTPHDNFEKENTEENPNFSHIYYDLYHAYNYQYLYTVWLPYVKDLM